MADKSNMGRRSLLRQAGAASAGLAGLATTATATDEQINDLTSKKSVQKILRALGRPEVLRGVKKEVGEDAGFSGIRLHTEVGNLLYAEVNGVPTGTVFKLLEESERPNASFNLPERFTGITQAGQASLIVDGSGSVEYTRPATETEQRRLSRTTDVSPTSAVMSYTSLVDKYEVHQMSGATDSETTFSDLQASYLVTLENTHGTTSVEDVTDQQLSAQDQLAARGQCETWADRCMNQIMICIGCGGLCFSVPVTNIPGVIACITCVMGCHFTVPLACGKTVQNC